MKTATFYDASSPGGLAHRPTAASPLQPAAAAQLPQRKVDVRVSVCWLAQYRLVLVALVSKMQSSEVHSAKTHYHCEIPVLRGCKKAPSLGLKVRKNRVQ